MLVRKTGNLRFRRNHKAETDTLTNVFKRHILIACLYRCHSLGIQAQPLSHIEDRLALFQSLNKGLAELRMVVVAVFHVKDLVMQRLAGDKIAMQSQFHCRFTAVGFGILGLNFLCFGRNHRTDALILFLRLGFFLLLRLNRFRNNGSRLILFFLFLAYECPMSIKRAYTRHVILSCYLSSSRLLCEPSVKYIVLSLIRSRQTGQLVILDSHGVRLTYAAAICIKMNNLDIPDIVVFNVVVRCHDLVKLYHLLRERFDNTRRDRISQPNHIQRGRRANDGRQCIQRVESKQIGDGGQQIVTRIIRCYRDDTIFALRYDTLRKQL